ncbi:MAG TPA: dienelactone hydrolase family protein [Verrucomicrobiae bacterium]|jgi:carboxymethylenebutenolidase|nr:dienelactone hydrolase family protein [Verrucomicrobiae bacterium]
MKRFLLLTTAGLLIAASASAQDWAKAKLEKSPRHGEWVKLHHDNRDVESFITYPEVKDKATAVVVIHEIFGLSDWARNVTDELAAAGYIAIAPDLLSGKGPNGGGTAALGGDDGARKVIGSLPPNQITADLNAAVDYVSKLPSCNGKVVVMGFCWGGGQAFRFATNNKDIKAAFSFYGPIPDESTFSRIQCPVYGFYAEKDARITSTVPSAAEAMQKAGKTYETVVYEGAGHGFMRAGEAPDATEANKKAHDQAWQRAKELLSKIN